MRYFTYKVYRVDPLTRTNLYETEDNDTTDIDKPLIEVRYGSSNEALKCKLPLKDLQTEIGKRKGDPNWKFQGGEMYRIVLEMEEYVGMNYDKNELSLKYEFSQRLPVAKAKTSVIFRCYDPDEQKNTGKELLDTDFTPLQWMEDAEQLSADQVHTIGLVNGKAGMTDWEADGKIFDVYYQWWETDADGNPKRMIAGTDNIFEGEHEDRDKHVPSSFNVGSDGKTYVNTVNPEDPKADSYGENGLPENPQLWNYKQLHMYTFRMTPIELLKRIQELNLSLNNNNVLATNTDSCYIPMEMAGKYVRVKAVVMNPKWLDIYDLKQTFWSHPIKVVAKPDALRGDLSLSYSEGMNYATYDKPFTLSLNRLEGLTEGETVSEVSFIANGHQKTFTDLNLTDLSKLPSVKYPEDFYAEDYPLEQQLRSQQQRRQQLLPRQRPPQPQQQPLPPRSPRPKQRQIPPQQPLRKRQPIPGKAQLSRKPKQHRRKPLPRPLRSCIPMCSSSGAEITSTLPIPKVRSPAIAPLSIMYPILTGMP